MRKNIRNLRMCHPDTEHRKCLGGHQHNGRRRGRASSNDKSCLQSEPGFFSRRRVQMVPNKWPALRSHAAEGHETHGQAGNSGSHVLSAALRGISLCVTATHGAVCLPPLTRTDSRAMPGRAIGNALGKHGGIIFTPPHNRCTSWFASRPTARARGARPGTTWDGLNPRHRCGDDYVGRNRHAPCPPEALHGAGFSV